MSKFKSKEVSSEKIPQDNVANSSNGEIIDNYALKQQCADYGYESRVHSEETTVSSTISMEDKANSHKTSLEAGSFHDPLDTSNTESEEEVCTQPEDETPSVSTLTEDDFNTEFCESDEHIVCLQNAKLKLLDDKEPDPVLKAISRFYGHSDSHRKALGTLLHAAWATKRIVFGMSRPLLAKLLKADPNVPTINSEEINSTLYARVRKSCHESRFISIIQDSESGPRGKGKIAIFEVRFKPVVASVCDARGKKLSSILTFQLSQVQRYREGNVVPTWELCEFPENVEILKARLIEIVSTPEAAPEMLEDLIRHLSGAHILEDVANSVCEAVSDQQCLLGWAIAETIPHLCESGMQLRQLDQVPKYSVRRRDAASSEELADLMEGLEKAYASGRYIMIYDVLLNFLKKRTMSYRQKIIVASWLDNAVINEKKPDVWKLIVRNDLEGYPIPRPKR